MLHKKPGIGSGIEWPIISHRSEIMSSDIQSSTPKQGSIYHPIYLATAPVEGQSSLLELWLKLRPYRFMIIAVAGSISVIGLTYVLLTPKEYRFTTAIDLGMIVDYNGRSDVIEPASAAIIRLKETIIPTLLLTESPDGDPENWRLNVESEDDEDSRTLILSASAPLAKAEAYTDLERAIVSKLIAFHGARIDAIRQVYSHKKQSAQATLAENALLVASLRAEYQKTVETMDRLWLESENLQRRIRDHDAQERGLADSRADLADLNMRLNEILPMRQAQITGQLIELSSEAQRYRNEINAAEANLARIKLTNAMDIGVRSRLPVGPRRLVVLVLFGMTGLVLAIMLALLIDFYRHAEALAREQRVV